MSSTNAREGKTVTKTSGYDVAKHNDTKTRKESNKVEQDATFRKGGDNSKPVK